MTSKTAHRRAKAHPEKNTVRDKRTNRKSLLTAEARKPSTRIANRKRSFEKSRNRRIQHLNVASSDVEDDKPIRTRAVARDNGELTAILTSDQFKQMLTQLSNTLIQEFIDQTRTKIQAESEKVQKAISKIKKPLDKKINLIDTATTQKLESLRMIIDNVLGDKPCSCKASETTTIEKNFRKKKITKKQRTILQTFPTSEDLSDQFESLPIITFDSEPTQSAESDPILSQRKLSYPYESHYDAFPNQMSSDLDCIDRNSISCDSIFDQEHSISESNGLERQFGFADEIVETVPFIQSESNLLKCGNLKSDDQLIQYNLYSTDNSCRLTEDRLDLTNLDDEWHRGLTTNDDASSAMHKVDEFGSFGVDFYCCMNRFFPDVSALDQ